MKTQLNIRSATALLASSKCLFGAFVLATASAHGATVFLESGGRVVIEAEHFDSRTANTDGHKWQIVPDEGRGSAVGSMDFLNPRGGKYVQSLPDAIGGGINHNQAGDENTPPSLDYKVKVTTTGNYRLWLKWGGYDGSSDSVYSQIAEISSPAFFRFSRVPGGIDYNTIPWHGDAGLESNGGGQDGLDVPAVWNVTSAGTYTIRLNMREDGSTVDALVFQLQSLPDPKGIGPAESPTEGNTLPVVAPEITIQPSDTTAAEGTAATFTVGVKDNIVPSSIKWFKGDTEIAGANDLTLTTAPVTTADDGTKYKVTLANSAGQSVTSSVATLSVVANQFQTGVLQDHYFPGSTRQAVEAGTAKPSSPGTRLGSDASGLVPTWESGVNFADNYANRFSGYFLPPTTGNYIFFVSGDDDSDLFLSTDENPANKKLIAQEVSWSNSRQWLTAGGGTSTPEAKRSDSFEGTQWPGANTITLTAGKKYYIEGVHHEGGGGDDFGATYKLDSEDESLVANGTASRFTGSVIGVFVPQVIALGGVNAGFEKLTFTVTDVGSSVADPASARVTFDGQTFTPTASTKSPQGVTTFTYSYPSRLQQGSSHTYAIQARDTQGRPVSASSGFTLSTQWFPTTDLPGPAPVDKAWATRLIFGVKDASDTPVQMTGLANILNQIQAASKAGFNGQVVDLTTDVINWNTGGHFGNDNPYPDSVTGNSEWTGDDFINLNIGHLVIPEEGDYTFGVHSDDGFSLRIRGGQAISVNGEGQLDLADPETIVHPADTGDSNTRAVYHLKKGVFRIEFFWWERAGGDNGEIYAAKGAFANDGDTSTWRLVGDNTPSQELTLLGVDASGWSVISSDPGGDQLNTWADADADLAATGGGAKTYDYLNVGDPDTNAGVLAFPKDRPGVDDDDYAVKATATLVVPQDGTYVLGFNTDDGAYLKIPGQTFIAIDQNNTGSSVISGDTVTCDCLTGDSGTTATITLTKGNYAIEAGEFERGGGSFLAVRGALKPASTITTGDMPFLAKNAAGTKVQTPTALKLTNAPTGVDNSGSQPKASIALSAGFVTITSDSGGTVQQASSLSSATNWQDIGAAPQTVQATGAAQFFRLKK